ncbi:MAG: T9SS type A sorting domain-containing protein [Sphingobacteriales bacterium]|nr:T9SS type A sorting domain-containing protein [Sphingobacteriales bacterium]
MKKLVYTLAFLLTSTFICAQEAAMDFTKTDCDGNNHTLFSELDAGKVVVLDFVMMNCTPCITATKALDNLLETYAISHPNRVEIYSIGYLDNYTCQQMKNWRTDNNFEHEVFTEGAEMVAYYGGMGMPTIVIVAKDTHEVLYKTIGYSPSDNTDILAAINEGLTYSPVGIETFINSVVVTPNPFENTLSVSADSPIKKIQISDINGKVVLEQIFDDASVQVQVSTTDLQNGLYLLQYEDVSGKTALKKVFKQ